MHQDLLQLQACQNPFDDPKTQVPKIMIFWDHLDWCLGACWPKLLISREHFWATILSLDRNDINNLGPKGQPSKTILTLRGDASTRKAIYGMHRCPEQTNHENEKEKKNKRKIDCHVMHLKNSIRSKQESRIKCWKKWWKLHTHESLFPSCKESLFSLGDYVRDDKWPSFIIILL